MEICKTLAAKMGDQTVDLDALGELEQLLGSHTLNSTGLA